MSEVLMTLGDIRFSVQEGAFQRLTRTLELRVARMDRANAATARQALGEDETVEIEGVCYPGQRHALDRVDGFRALLRAKKPVMLTDGTGGVWGQFLVERVDEDASLHLANGVAQRQAFRIVLGAYGEDAA